MDEADFQLSPRDKDSLLQIARKTLETGLGKDPFEVWTAVQPPTLSDRVQEPHPCFVTLTKGKRLRGCVGTTHSTHSLAEGVCRNTLSASQTDPRFSPVQPEELPQIRLGISVLGPLSAYQGSLDLGREGLVVDKGPKRGLLLAKVAVDWQWDEETFLQQTFQKAGVPFPDPQAQVWKFREITFEEAPV